MWAEFKEKEGLSQDTFLTAEICFEDESINGAAKMALVLAGKKTAIFSSLATFSVDGEPMPVSGEYYALVDKNGKDVAILEMESVNIVPFCDVTWGMASQEAEDENLEAWKDRMKEVLTEEGAITGFDFRPDIKLVFQTFKVVYK